MDLEVSLGELFKESKMLCPLPRYDVTKWGPTRSFPGVFMNKQRRGFEKKMKFTRPDKINSLIFIPHASLFGRASGKILLFS